LDALGWLAELIIYVIHDRGGAPLHRCLTFSPNTRRLAQWRPSTFRTGGYIVRDALFPLRHLHTSAPGGETYLTGGERSGIFIIIIRLMRWRRVSGTTADTHHHRPTGTPRPWARAYRTYACSHSPRRPIFNARYIYPFCDVHIDFDAFCWQKYPPYFNNFCGLMLELSHSTT